MLLKIGDRVRVLEEYHVVENYEVKPKGRTGRVTEVLFDQEGYLEMVTVKLDRPLRGLEAWDNELQWHRDGYDAPDYPSLAEVILRELEFVRR